MAAYARTPSALTWLRVNHLINGLHKQISCKNCLYAVNSYFTLYCIAGNFDGGNFDVFDAFKPDHQNLTHQIFFNVW